jgi:hypothetical protein
MKESNDDGDDNHMKEQRGSRLGEPILRVRLLGLIDSELTAGSGQYAAQKLMSLTLAMVVMDASIWQPARELTTHGA